MGPYNSDDEWELDDYHWNGYQMKATRTAFRRGGRNKRRKGGGRMRFSACQVADCKNDLSFLKEYHRRYKICNAHMKSVSVGIGGIPQRFCEQCGRFHPLEEFDGNKRSCRLRLLKHNLRRRKKQEDPLTRPGSARSCTRSHSLSATASKIELDPEDESTAKNDDPKLGRMVSPFFPSQEPNVFFQNMSFFEMSK